MLLSIVLAVAAAMLVQRCQTLPPEMMEAVVLPAHEEPAASSDDVLVEDEEVPRLPEVFIEVNIPATEMIVYEDGVPIFVRRVAIGQGIYPTPVQQSVIKKIEWNPWWYPPPADWAKDAKPTPPGPGNPLGLVKMALSEAILFHGTNKDWTVGQPASHGCMRMHNRDATTIAWYLQEIFSDKRDPELRKLYGSNRGTTYVVNLVPPVPVKLVYRPVIVKEGSLFFYPDYYHRIGGRLRAEVLGTLLWHGIDLSLFDNEKIEILVNHWPSRGTSVPISNLMHDPPPPPMSGPECS